MSCILTIALIFFGMNAFANFRSSFQSGGTLKNGYSKMCITDTANNKTTCSAPFEDSAIPLSQQHLYNAVSSTEKGIPIRTLPDEGFNASGFTSNIRVGVCKASTDEEQWLKSRLAIFSSNNEKNCGNIGTNSLKSSQGQR
ncbi:MAG: hypothetical protein ACXVCR_20095 [Bdellovibrio sp.]